MFSFWEHLLLCLQSVFGYIITGDVALLTCTDQHSSPPLAWPVESKEKETKRKREWERVSETDKSHVWTLYWGQRKYKENHKHYVSENSVYITIFSPSDTKLTLLIFWVCLPSWSRGRPREWPRSRTAPWQCSPLQRRVQREDERDNVSTRTCDWMQSASFCCLDENKAWENLSVFAKYARHKPVADISTSHCCSRWNFKMAYISILNQTEPLDVHYHSLSNSQHRI